jgi:hypothetical protein
MAKDSGRIDRRAWQRFFIPVTTERSWCLVNVEDGAAARVRVCDISLGGVCVELVEDGGADRDETLFPEQSVYFSQCDVEKWGKYLCGAQGHVKWRDGRFVGLLFERPLGMGKD